MGSVIFGVSFAGAKLATVTNPMQTDLDANAHAIVEAQGVQSRSFHAVPPGETFPSGDVVASVYYAAQPNLSAPSIFSGLADPSVSCPTANPGSLYLREVTHPPTTGEVWAKTANPCGWTRIAP